VFLLGLCCDLLGGTAPGVMALLLLAVHAVAIGWRPGLLRSGFLVRWLVFSLLAVAACALQWGLSSLLRLTVLPLAPAAFELALAWALYPPLSACLAWAHRSVADPRRA
jgi:hypothetical protein